MTEKDLTQNQIFLQEAQAKTSAFEYELEAQRLREASLCLERISLAREVMPEDRAIMRKAVLIGWLKILALLDKHLDPDFDPEDVPATTVQPPRTAKGVQYPPGAAPALIDDPKLRAEYEKAIAAERAKADHYRLQTHLRRINERTPPRADAFIIKNYTRSPLDEAQWKGVVDKLIENPARKEHLLKLLDPK